jgi:hypothetical protein
MLRGSTDQALMVSSQKISNERSVLLVEGYHQQTSKQLEIIKLILQYTQTSMYNR